MIFLTKFYRRYQRTNLRVLLLWLVLTQIFMFILYTHLVKFIASPNANKWIYMKGPRLPVQHRIMTTSADLVVQEPPDTNKEKIIQNALKFILADLTSPRTREDPVANEVTTELSDAKMTQWDNFESMLYLKYARAEDNAQFNRCNVKYSFDILEDVLKIKHSTLTNNSQGLDDLMDSAKVPLNSPVFEVRLNPKFLGRSFQDVPDAANRVCLMQRFDKKLNATESFQSIGRVMKLYKENNYFLRVKQAGFYELRCLFLAKEPNWYKRFYSDVFTILPKDMRELKVKQNEYKAILQKEKKVDFSQKRIFEACLNKETEIKPVENRKQMNVLILALGSVAKNHFRRIFPITYKYLTQDLYENIFYERFNKIGENAYPNFLPAFTGLVVDSYKELNISNEVSFYKNADSTFHDHFPFIWKEFENLGYLTQYNEEKAKLGMFNLNRKGFRYPPTSLYNQPFNLKLEDMHKPVICYQHQPVYEKTLKDISRFVSHMNSPTNSDIPYFSFNFMKYLTHGFLSVPKTFDIQLKDLIAGFEKQKLLDNTLLVIMSDHGSRLTKYSYQSKVGRMERSTPFFSMRLPKQLIGTEFHRNAVSNKDKLFTAHDVHKTLNQFYYLNQNSSLNSACRQRFARSDREVRSLRGISLFEKHPENRSCYDALIPVLFCGSKKITNLSEKEFLKESGSEVMAAANLVLIHVNKVTSSERKKCAKFEIGEVMSVKVLSESFARLFVVNVKLEPGNAIFEAYLKMDAEKKLKIYNKVLRVNKYAKQSKCVEKRSLMGFCYCQENF